MRFVFFTFWDDVGFSKFNFDYFFQIEAHIHRNLCPVFILAECLALGMTGELLRAEKMDLFPWFSI